MYFTDRGIEELERRRAEDEVDLGWIADRMREFVHIIRVREDVGGRAQGGLTRTSAVNVGTLLGKEGLEGF